MTAALIGWLLVVALSAAVIAYAIAFRPAPRRRK